MKDLEMNRIIAWGLVVMGVMSIAGWIAYFCVTGTPGGTEIPIAIISGLGGVLTGKELNSTKRTQSERNDVQQ